jgi:ATP-binding protein involved in chromosome partitioning
MKDKKRAESAIARLLASIAAPGGSGTVADSPLLAGISVGENGCNVILDADKGEGAEALERLITEEAERSALGFPVRVVVTGRKEPPAADKRQRVRGAKRVILVCSGKGGAGKSTVAVAVALRLRTEGYRIGLADADVHGPSLPVIFGLRETPSVSPETEKMIPIEAEGLQIMSVGLLVPEGQALAWRGPMVSKTLMQVLLRTEWQGLDALIVDMPPGTGDAQLSVASNIVADAALPVTQPHPLSVADAKRACAMLKKTGVPILGVIENMSYIKAGGETLRPFGQGGGERLAAECGAPLLESIPLAPQNDDALALCRSIASELSPETVRRIVSLFR